MDIFYFFFFIATIYFVIFLNHTYCYNLVFFQFHQTDLTNHNLPTCEFNEIYVELHLVRFRSVPGIVSLQMYDRQAIEGEVDRTESPTEPQQKYWRT